tara:strand:- start:870 stop:1505 length:636 start_codon:yes stop_codon:yes gene_type:complete
MANPNHTKEQILDALQDPAVADAAIVILTGYQTAEERRRKSTSNENGEGFDAAYGKLGVRFWEFLTGRSSKTGELVPKWGGPKSLRHPKANRVFARNLRNSAGQHETVLDYARFICGKHWKQLGMILEDDFQAPELPTAPEPAVATQKQESREAGGQIITISGEVVGVKGRAYKANVGGRNVWLPKSQVTIVDGAIMMPRWLAQNKGFVTQ